MPCGRQQQELKWYAQWCTGWRGVDKMDIVQINPHFPPVPSPEPVPAPAPLVNTAAPISRDLPQNPLTPGVIAGIVTACFIAIGAATRFIGTRHAESLRLWSY